MSSSVFCVFWCFCSVLLCVVVIGGVEEVRKSGCWTLIVDEGKEHKRKGNGNALERGG